MKKGEGTRETKRYIVPRGAPQLYGCDYQPSETAEPPVIRNVYKIGALPSYQPEVPARITAEAAKPRPSVTDWKHRRMMLHEFIRRFVGVLAVCASMLIGAFILFSLLFLAAIGD